MYNPAQFSIQSTAEANYLYVTPGDAAVYDLIAVRMLTEDAPDFLMPLHVSEVNGEISLRYKLINGTALKFAGDTAVTKKQYVALALELLTPFVQCKDWLLDYHAICIDPAYILRDRHTGRFLFVYLPANTLAATDTEILDFIRNTLTYIDISDDKDFQIRMMRYFRDGGYTIGDMYALFKAEAEKMPGGNTAAGTASQTSPQTTQQNTVQTAAASAVSGTAAQEPAPVQPNEKELSKKGLLDMLGIGGGPAKKPEKEPEPTPAPAAEPVSVGGIGMAEDNVMAALFGSDKNERADKHEKAEKKESGGGLLGALFGQNNAKPAKKEPKKTADLPSAAAPHAVQPAAQPMSVSPDPQAADPFANLDATSINPFSDDGRTMIGSESGSAQNAYLTLLDSSYSGCPETISLAFKKPFVIVGRKAPDTPAPDIAFPENCKGVSRKHLRITRREDGVLCITDLGSEFGTLLGSQRLIPNTEYPLTNGMILTLVEQKPIRYTVHI